MNSNYKIWNQVVEIFQKEYNKLFEKWCLGKVSEGVLNQATKFLITYKPLFEMYNIYYYNLKIIETSNEMIGSLSYYLQEIEFHLQEKTSQEELQIGQKASEISKVPEIQNIINEIIQTITKNGGYVVVGRDATTKILPSARVKLILEANFETRVYRRAKQLNAKEFEAIGKVFSDLLKRDFDSFDFVLEAKKVATIINTSDLSIEQVVAKILSRVL
ncbi:Cytidylate kinase [Gigaspora margarita]|uniref:(d)CMP kinase n=1 Tax=Gigaspora margarita TaxID=4874 RepID=A0A8H4EVZ9_GIGMA|nr:Cytidylate kinase [Gigaspora margarita]